MDQTDFSFELTSAGGPFQDPGLLVLPRNSSQLILFDCGTLHGLKTRDLLRVKWLVLSHLHIDHLIGFDHLLRLRLFSELPLFVFGPEGTTEIIGHRLQGYSWNLTSGSPFEVKTVDFGDQAVTKCGLFRCHNQFQFENWSRETPETTRQLELSQDLKLHWHPVEHGVPCHCYRLDRSFPPRFSPKNAASLGLKPGPWVKKLLSDQTFRLEVEGETRNRDWLASRLLEERDSDCLGYLTDTLLQNDLRDLLSDFYRKVDVLVSECAYLEIDTPLATQNLHMTTTQVATLAKQAEVAQLAIFHLSKRYADQGPQEHLKEVRRLFPAARTLK